jgi:crossover junction endodeoxyribonuclease RuvC
MSAPLWKPFCTFAAKGKILSAERIILGIDPGTTIMGYGIVRWQGSKMSLVCHGVIHLSKYEDHALKLKVIFEKVIGLIEQYHPDELAIEAPFYGKNVQSMLKLGRAQGVAIAAALSRSMPYMEYAPRRIKQAVTGNGNASKEQVAAMLKTLLKMDEMPEHLDATDGLAAAVCHGFQAGKSSNTGSYTSWKSFLSKNPGRKI